MMRLGIIQGRLSQPVKNRIQAFPVQEWREEFVRCQELGIDCIEWIFEYEGADQNPLSSAAGIKEMLAIQKKTGVAIHSLLADYFMVKKLFGHDAKEVQEAVRMLNFLIAQCQKCGIPLIEIPLVDASALKTESDKASLRTNLKESLQQAETQGITLSLETALPPKEFRDFIATFKTRALKINYDMGNSASLGYEPSEEIELIGDYIANVHIKDRVKAGGTVPFGEGNTDFSAVFGALRRKKYNGDFMLQGARQDLAEVKAKKEIKETIHGYINFVKPYLREFA